MQSKLTIKQIQDKKQELESDILNLFTKFSSETSLHILYIDMETDVYDVINETSKRRVYKDINIGIYY